MSGMIRPTLALTGSRWVAFALLAAGCSRPDAASPVVDRAAASPVFTASRAGAAASADHIRRFCGDCHAYPPPDSFPKANWPSEVRRGFDFHRKSGQERDAPSVEATVAYY